MNTRAWAGLAERLGASFDAAKGEITGRLEGVRFAIETTQEAQEVGPSGQVGLLAEILNPQTRAVLHDRTRLAVEARVAAALGLSVRPQGFWQLGKIDGDIELGDRHVDRRWIIRCEDPLLARSWLDATAREALAGLPRDGFGEDRERLVVNYARVNDDAAELERHLRHLIIVAAGGRRLVERWRQQASALGFACDSDDDLMIAGLGFQYDGKPLTLHGRRGSHSLAIRLGARKQSTFTSVTLEQQSASTRPLEAFAPDAVPEPLRQAFAVCGADKASRKGHRIEVSLPGLEPDGSRLEAAISLTLGLVDEGAAAYR